jgi:hypothetical protein
VVKLVCDRPAVLPRDADGIEVVLPIRVEAGEGVELTE